MSDPSPPSRAEVAAQWTALIKGKTTREAVHAWAVPWVEGDAPVEDPMILSALTYLHGFDLTRHLTTRPGWPTAMTGITCIRRLTSPMNLRTGRHVATSTTRTRAVGPNARTSSPGKPERPNSNSATGSQSDAHLLPGLFGLQDWNLRHMV